MNNNLSQFELLTIQQGNRNFILAIIVAIITFLSVVLIYIDYRNRKNKERAEKSIEIAKDFTSKIIRPISFLYAFFKEYDIDKIITKIEFIQLEDFDLDELQKLYTQEDIQTYKIAMEKNDPNRTINNKICDVLNTLEYMCMYIATNVADEKYIYNSLHQQFLKAIACFYFHISLINIDEKNKYYTNIIHVYNLWKNKYIKAMRKEKKFIRNQRKKKQKLLHIPKI